MARESRLAEIYKMELKNKGLLSALVSAAGERSKEKTDFRRLLPSSGITGAAFGKMFGKPYQYGQKKSSVGNRGSSSIDREGDSGLSKEANEKLTRISSDLRITAKNTIVLPAMARDMNLMRLNIQKMVKLSGGKATKDPDALWKDKKEREKQYKGQLKQNTDKSKEKTPTPADGGEKEKGGGVLMGLLGMAGAGVMGIASLITSFFGTIFKVILASGVIGMFLQDQSTRDGLKDFFVNLLKGFFEGVKNTFATVSEIFKDPEMQKALGGAIGAIFTALGDFLKISLTEIKTPFGNINVTIGGAIGIIVASLAAFNVAMTLLQAKLMSMVITGGGSRSGGVGGGSRSGGKMSGLGKLGLAAGAVGLGAGLFGGGNQTDAQGNAVTGTDKSAGNIGMNAVQAAASVGSIAVAGKTVAGLAQKGALNVATSPPTSKWGKFLTFVEKKAPKLFAKIGMRLATAGAMATVPGPGWVMALVNIGMGLYAAYELYVLWKEYTGSNDSEKSPTKETDQDKKIEDAKKENGPTAINSETGKEEKLRDFSKNPLTEEEKKKINDSTNRQLAGGGKEKEAVSVFESKTPTPAAKPTSTTEKLAGGTVTSTPGGAAVAVERTPQRVTDPTSIMGKKAAAASAVGDEPSEDLVNFIKQKESFSAKAFADNQQYSIGYGTKANSKDEEIDEKEADKRLRETLKTTKKQVIDYGVKKGYSWNQNQTDALTSFAYNLGIGALDQVTNGGKRTNAEIAEAIPKYNKAGGKVLAGLDKRRGDELSMFSKSGESSTSGASTPTAETVSSTPATSPKVSGTASPTSATSPKVSGTALAAASAENAASKSTPPAATPAINSSAPNNASSGGNAGGGGGNLATASVYDTELAKKFFNSSAFA
jgi:GH24 family phage-related lysozyme (muramidase)